MHLTCKTRESCENPNTNCTTNNRKSSARGFALLHCFNLSDLLGAHFQYDKDVFSKLPRPCLAIPCRFSGKIMYPSTFVFGLPRRK